MVARMDTVDGGLPALPADAGNVRILGVDILNISSTDAISLMESIVKKPQSCSRAIFIVNAHTLNLASENRDYHDTLQRGDIVFGDGTGVRWAARLRGTTMKDNLVGTDLIPRLFESTAGMDHRYFLLGADADTIERAANHATAQFGGWHCAGYHHGYVDDVSATNSLIETINSSRPDLLLVGMGNPKQERWIQEHLEKLRVPICVGVGGLFDHWGGNLRRAARPIRALGFEWLQLLFQQPKKWRRYVLGNPKFLYRIIRARRADLEQSASTAG